MALFNDIKNAVAAPIGNIANDFQKRGQQVVQDVSSGAEAYNDAVHNRINPFLAGAKLAGTGIQTAGAVAGGALDILGEGVNTFAKPIANAFVNSSAGQNLTSNKNTQQLAGIVDKAGAAYNNIAQKYPDTTKTAEAAGNIAMLLGLNSAFKGADSGKVTTSSGKTVDLKHSEQPYNATQIGQQISNHFKSAEQVLADPDLKGTVQMGDLLNRTKTNIVDDLKYGGANDVVKDVNKLNLGSYKNLDDFKADVGQIVTNKAATDFIKNPSAIPLFRGESMDNQGGVHFTPNNDWAKKFGNTSVTGTLPKDAKVFKIDAKSMQDAMDQGIKTDKDFYNYIFQKGYDAVLGTDSRNGQILDVVVNPKHLDSFKVDTAPAPSQFLSPQSQQGFYDKVYENSKSSNFVQDPDKRGMFSPQSMQGGFIKNPLANPTPKIFSNPYSNQPKDGFLYAQAPKSAASDKIMGVNTNAESEYMKKLMSKYKH